MLAHFGVLEEVRAALAREAEAGQGLLAQGRAQLQRCRQDISTQLLGTRNELARLHTRLEAARRDVLQWVRGMGWGVPKDPPGRGAAVQTPGVLHKGDAHSTLVEVTSWAAPSGLS